VRTLTAALITEKAKASTASAWLYLIQIVVGSGDVRYYVPNPVTVTFNSITYSPAPCRVDVVTADTKGGLPEVRVQIANIDVIADGHSQRVSTYLEANDLRGHRVTLLAINSANLGDPLATAFVEDYEITDIDVAQDWVTFTLGQERLLTHRFPGGRFLRDNCRWLYKGVECGYTGALPTCDKILEGSNGCRAHNNVARFGAYPGIPSIKGRFA
jgi:phage-related protein